MSASNSTAIRAHLRASVAGSCFPIPCWNFWVFPSYLPIQEHTSVSSARPESDLSPIRAKMHNIFPVCPAVNQRDGILRLDLLLKSGRRCCQNGARKAGTKDCCLQLNESLLISPIAVAFDRAWLTLRFDWVCRRAGGRYRSRRRRNEAATNRWIQNAGVKSSGVCRLALRKANEIPTQALPSLFQVISLDHGDKFEFNKRSEPTAPHLSAVPWSGAIRGRDNSLARGRPPEPHTQPVGQEL